MTCRRWSRHGGIGRGLHLYLFFGMGRLVLGSMRVLVRVVADVEVDVVNVDVASTPKTVVNLGVVIFAGVFPRWIVYWTL